MSVYDSDDWRAWVAAVRAAPDDDVVRLAAADWLEEDGYASHARFIRLQCDDPASRLEFTNVPHRNADRGRFLAKWVLTPGRHAFGGCRKVLTAGLPAPLPSSRIDVRFRRGFADEVETTWDQWQAHGDAILAREPVQRVTLTTMPEFEPKDTETARQHGVKHRYFDLVEKVRLHELRTRWPQVPADGWTLPAADYGRSGLTLAAE